MTELFVKVIVNGTLAIFLLIVSLLLMAAVGYSLHHYYG